MKKTIKLFLAISLLFLPEVFLCQGLNPASILKPAINSWPTYAGDYSQRHYSLLNQIDQSNVHALTLAWVQPADGRAGSRCCGIRIFRRDDNWRRRKKSGHHPGIEQRFPAPGRIDPAGQRHPLRFVSG